MAPGQMYLNMHQELTPNLKNIIWQQDFWGASDYVSCPAD